MNIEKNISDAFVYRSDKIFSNPAGGQSEAVARNWTIWHVGAGLGLLGGLLILFGALFLSGFEYLAGERPLGTWLFAAVPPLWVLGAHCFDKIEESEKRARRALCPPPE